MGRQYGKPLTALLEPEWHYRKQVGMECIAHRLEPVLGEKLN